jgi:hypothetical protein
LDCSDGGRFSGLAGGSPAGTDAASSAGPDETALRARLGVPPEARQVLVFGETSHWDPNWLHTSEEYYALCIPGILVRVMQALEEEPRRVFSIESLFFLQRYWQSNPAQHERLRGLINQRRLRLTGTGITTPDTVLPDTEAILRDYADGQEWLREHGMTVEPRLAYLPDDFGHSPALPTMLVALGFDMAAVTRIDGMYFIGCDYRRKSSFPLQGSSAHRLIRELKTADFVWRGPDGSQVLCHWNPFTYFQGDLLASIGVIRWMDRLYGFPWRTEAHVARRIRRFVRDLAPLARTPYLFCPMGGDFNGPIEGLVELLDRYNRTRYQQSGIWAVDAGLDDYLALVDCHRSVLPVVTMDPNPYWMGFYASRPEAKRRSNRIVRKLVIAEKLTVLPARAAIDPSAADGPVEPEIARDLRQAWDLTVMSNHHDFITGTSPDRIWQEEQLPLLERAELLADNALARIRAIRPPAAASPRMAPPRWRLDAGKLVVDAEAYHVELDERQGGAITSFRLGGSTEELLVGPANDLVSYRDSGGLWRLGHEFLGGVFAERTRASRLPARISAEDLDGVLQVRVDSEFEGRPFVRWLWLRQGSPVLRMRLVGSARRRRTITCRFPTRIDAQELTMDVPGGIVLRPAHKLYRPTFWPARSFVHLRSRSGPVGLAAFLGGPAAVASDGAGALEWIALRHAPREMAFRVLPILSHPASGTDPHQGQFDYAVWFTTGGDARDNRLPHHVRRALRAAMFGPHEPDLDELANSVVVVDRDDVQVTALKPAFRGEGVVVRLASFAEKTVDVTVSCPSRPFRTATLCDARERRLRDLEVRGGSVIVPMPYALASVLVSF